MPPGEAEVVQHISLAFVTATLYLLVQPRPKVVDMEVNILDQGGVIIGNLGTRFLRNQKPEAKRF